MYLDYYGINKTCLGKEEVSGSNPDNSSAVKPA